jgi:hypothetical protein
MTTIGNQRNLNNTNAPMMKLVDMTGLKSVGQQCPCRFKSYLGYNSLSFGPLAQSVEQDTHNVKVGSSNLSGSTKY